MNLYVDTQYASPNFDDRPEGALIKHLILHYTACDFQTSLKYLVGSKAPNRVSCHYLVNEAGRIFQLVDEEKRAWHAGSDSKWEDDINLNNTSIGIEIVNLGHEVSPLPIYPDAQLQAVKTLCLDLIQRYKIQPWYVLGHSDICLGRKIDPGEHFPWQAFSHVGIGHFHPGHKPNIHEPVDIKTYQTFLKNYGYNCSLSGELDDAMMHAITAFQRRFSPQRVDGKIYAQDVIALKYLFDHKQNKKTA